MPEGDTAARPNARYVLPLAIGAAIVLAGGALLKPAEPTATPPVSLTESSTLRALSRRGDFRSMAEFIAERVAAAGSHLVYLPALGAGGVVWDSAGTAVSAGQDEMPVVAVPFAGTDGTAPAVSAPAGLLADRGWVLLAARQADGTIASSIGMYGGEVRERCADEEYRVMVLSVPLGPALAGGGAFDLDGNLRGVVSRCGEGYAVLPREEVARALRLRGSSDSPAIGSLGLEVAALDPLAQRYFAADSGVLITGVALGGRGAGAGLRPGDVVLAANSQVIRAPRDLATLTVPSPGSGPTLTLFRAGRVRRVPIPEAGPADSTLGLALPAAAAGLELASVVPGSPAERAGLRRGDRIVRVNAFEHPTVAQVLRALRGTNAGPVYLVYQRRNRERGVFLRP